MCSARRQTQESEGLSHHHLTNYTDVVSRHKQNKATTNLIGLTSQGSALRLAINQSFVRSHCVFYRIMTTTKYVSFLQFACCLLLYQLVCSLMDDFVLLYVLHVPCSVIWQYIIPSISVCREVKGRILLIGVDVTVAYFLSRVENAAFYLS